MIRGEDDYVLLTAARDEEAYIAETILSVARQSVLPRRWVIVDDNSRDRTGEIVRELAGRFPFITPVEMGGGQVRDFSSKVYAINRGRDLLRETPFSFLGILDADITLEPDYYRKVVEEFRRDPALGLAGGILVQVGPEGNREFLFTESSVSGGVQMFRRECLDSVGDFLPLRYGGEDALAEASARMRGWGTRTFREIRGWHHRHEGTSSWSRPVVGFHHGRRDHAYGVHPLFELFRVVRRLRTPPCLLYSLLLGAGYLSSWAGGQKRVIPDDLRRFVRQEQMDRLRKTFSPRDAREGKGQDDPGEGRQADQGTEKPGKGDFCE